MNIVVTTSTAMDSLTNRNMVYLDIVSGLFGTLLFVSLKDSIYNFNFEHFESIDVFSFLIARSLTDFFYAKFISDTNDYKSSTSEFTFTSIIWLIFKLCYTKIISKSFNINDVFLQYFSIIFVMSAVNNLTNWRYKIDIPVIVTVQ